MSHVAAASVSGVGATPSFDSTGVGTLIVGFAYFGSHTISDNKGNTLTPLTEFESGGTKFRLYVCSGGTFGTGHVITASHSALRVMTIARTEVLTVDSVASSGVGSSSAGANVNTISCGSITTTAAGRLLIAGGSFGNGIISLAINSGYTAVHGFGGDPGVSYGGGMAYLEQASAGATSPSYSWGGNAQPAVAALVSLVANDTTPPTITTPTGTSITTSAATVGATTNEAGGTAYVVAVTTGTTAPSAAQVIAGQDGTGAAVAAGLKRTLAISATGAFTFAALSGLAASTGYTYYVTHQDAAGNNSSVLSGAFTTAALATPGTPAALAGISATLVDVTVTLGAAADATSYEARIAAQPAALAGAYTPFATVASTWANLTIGTTYNIGWHGVNGGSVGPEQTGTFRVELGTPTVSGGTFVAALIPFLNQ